MEKEPENTLLKTLNEYEQEFNEDSRIHEMNIRDKQMMLPGIKHKYVAYLIKHKRKKFELEKYKSQAIDELISKSTPDIGLSTPALVKKHENHPAVKKINKLIEEQDIIISYMEKIEYITRSMTYDLSNLIKIIELETT